MLKLILYQLNYKKQYWFGLIPMLLAASIVNGSCLMIIFNVINNIDIFGKEVPTPLFIGPVFFGGITLLLLFSSLIQLILDLFKEDYALWNILGADSLQLSLFVGAEMAIISFFIGFIGSFISFFVARSYYYFVQNITGRMYLPSIDFTFNLSAFVLSIFILVCLSFLGGFWHTLKLLKRINFFEEGNFTKHSFKKYNNLFGSLCLIFFWLFLVAASLMIPHLNLQGSSEYKLSAQVSIILYIIIIHIILLQTISPWIEDKLTKILFKYHFSYGSVMAKWNILLDKFYLKSLTVSLVTAITLITGLILLSNNNIRNTNDQVIEMYVSFLFYLIAPIIIILANIVSIMIISAFKEKDTVQQWQMLGVSKINIIIIRFYESIIYSTLVFFISMFFNLIVTGLLINVNLSMDIYSINYMYVYLPDVFFSLIVFIIIFATKIVSVFPKSKF